MNNTMTFFKLLRLFNTILLLLALGDWPYEYYTLLRVITFATNAWGALKAYRQNLELFLFLFAVVAILFNPFLPIHLSPDTWAFFDVAAAVYLITTIKALDSDET